MIQIGVVCAALFGLGLYGALTRHDLVAVLACIEIMLGSANVLLVALASSAGGLGKGQAFGLVLVVLAAAEASVGLALVLATARKTGRERVEELTEVRG